MNEQFHQANRVSYREGMSACEKGEQWVKALPLLGDMNGQFLVPNVVSYSARSAAMSARKASSG